MTKKQLERVIVLMAQEIIYQKYKGVQMTMYAGKYEAMVDDQIKYFKKLEKETK
jgi:hypothetical protein